jgi:hypothetical protein
MSLAALTMEAAQPPAQTIPQEKSVIRRSFSQQPETLIDEVVCRLPTVLLRMVMDYAAGLIIQPNHRLPGCCFIASDGSIHSYPADTYPLNPLESTIHHPDYRRRTLPPRASFFVRNNPWIFSPTPPRPALTHIVTKRVISFPHFTSKVINWDRSGAFLLAHSPDGLFCYYPDNRSYPLLNNQPWVNNLIPTQTDIASDSGTIAAYYGDLTPNRIFYKTIYTWQRNAEGKPWEQADSVPLHDSLNVPLLLSQNGRYMPIPIADFAALRSGDPSACSFPITIYDRIKKKTVAKIDYHNIELSCFFQLNGSSTRLITAAQGRNETTLIITAHNAETGALECTQRLPGVAKGFKYSNGYHTNLVNDTGTTFFIPQDTETLLGILGEF